MTGDLAARVVGTPKPGDFVTIELHLDGWCRTSRVKGDGSYVGCAAVAGGWAHIVNIWPQRALPSAAESA